MNKKTIVIVEDFDAHPYGRTIEIDGDSSGESFRIRILTPALHKYDHVHVVLTGYNRYGRSFLDEAFGGLIREDGFTGSDIDKQLTYSHDSVRDIEKIIAERIRAAIEAKST